MGLERRKPAAAGAGGITYIYVEENGFASTIATHTYTSATTIGAIGLALEAEINAGTSYTAVWVGAGVNELTITDARNLVAAGNALVLDFLCQGGAGGAILSNFAGGVNGVETAATIDTINGAASCRRLTVFNNMAAETITLDSSGNIVVAAPVVLAAKTWRDLLSVDGINWYLGA